MTVLNNFRRLIANILSRITQERKKIPKFNTNKTKTYQTMLIVTYLLAIGSIAFFLILPSIVPNKLAEGVSIPILNIGIFNLIAFGLFYLFSVQFEPPLFYQEKLAFDQHKSSVTENARLTHQKYMNEQEHMVSLHRAQNSGRCLTRLSRAIERNNINMH